MKPPKDRVLARRVMQAHATSHGCSLDDVAGTRKYPGAVAARHGAWAELVREHGWSCARVGRACGVDHTSVSAAMRKYPPGSCPSCGELYSETREAPLTFECGVATQRVYQHERGFCVTQTAWVLRGEEAPA